VQENTSKDQKSTKVQNLSFWLTASFLAYSEFCPEPTRHKRVQKVQEDKGHVEVIHLSRADFRATRYKRVNFAISEFDRFSHINSFSLIF